MSVRLKWHLEHQLSVICAFSFGLLTTECNGVMLLGADFATIFVRPYKIMKWVNMARKCEFEKLVVVFFMIR